MSTAADWIIQANCFGKGRLRVISFTLVLAFWSLSAFSCDIDEAFNDGSSTKSKVNASGEFFILIGSVIVLILECINIVNKYFTLNIVCGGFIIIGSILYLISMIMDLNDRPSVFNLIISRYPIPGITALVVGMDITQKIKNIMDSSRARMVIFCSLLIVCGLFKEIWNFNQDFITDRDQWFEAGWMLIVISSLIILIVAVFMNKTHICLFNVIFGCLLFFGAAIVLYLGIDRNSSNNVPCFVSRIIGYNVIVFFDAFVIVCDLQIGSSCASNTRYRAI